MESKLSPDQEKNVPPVPIKTYHWEDVRKAREAGGYPWTHLFKEPLEGEITAEDILRESTPRRTMSREFSRSRTRSPVDKDVQKIIDLDASPGSSRKHGESGEDEGIQIPHFSKEVSTESEEDNIKEAVKAYIVADTDTTSGPRLLTPVEIPKNISPKGILKRRTPEQQYVVGLTETREKTKCCHPLVNKIKHLADKTLHKLERSENEKSPTAKRKKHEDGQEIRQLKSSPGAVRRQKFSAIKLGDSDEMSKTMSVETPPLRKKKEHIYEDIEEKNQEAEKNLHFASHVEEHEIKVADEENKSNNNKETESLSERKSNASQDPSLVMESVSCLKPEEHVMEILHKRNSTNKEAILLDEEMDPEEPNIDEVFQNQFDDRRKKNDSPNITITEIIDEVTEITEIIDVEPTGEHNTTIPIETSPSPSPRQLERKINEAEFASSEWSKPSSDHEYEPIEKPQPNISYNNSNKGAKTERSKTDDELSSTTSLERKYLQPASDDDDMIEDKENLGEEMQESLASSEALQRDIEDRYFANTPSTVSRTECEISTSQVDSSALENLPLNRANRSKNAESFGNKIQQRFKEGTGKLKSQAGKLNTKIQNIKTPQFSMPERPKFKMPERPKFSLPDKRKFSLPDRPKFKKINISEKLSLGDRKKFTLPDRPKFNVPDLPKFRMPERPKINFPSLGRKKEYKVETMETTTTTGSTSDIRNVPSVEFEAKTYPRLFGRKKKSAIQKTSSSPTLNREDTPPPTFTFTRVKQIKTETKTSCIPDSPAQPREYGNVDNEPVESRHFETTYDFDNVDADYMKEPQPSQYNASGNISSVTDFSPNPEYTHVINEIDNDEFFVRPRGISRENIQVREYLSDEIRQAFKIPKNVLASMGSDPRINDENITYSNELDADPELMIDENETGRYSTEDLNDRDDGYYTFPPVRPSRAKRKKKDFELTDTIQYIDDTVHNSRQFSEVDLGLSEENLHKGVISNKNMESHQHGALEFQSPTDLRSIHEYSNDDVLEYPDEVMIQSQTLPMPPKRKKRGSKKNFKHSSLLNIKDLAPSDRWTESCEPSEDIIVYRVEHEYIVPQADITMTTTEQSPLPPRRNRSRSSRGTSLCDDDRTSHGADSLTLDTTHAPLIEDIREIRQESPGYATVDKTSATKPTRRSKSKTPPVRRRKSNSSERKYYTVGATKGIPDRPPRKKSSTSLMTLDSYSKRSVSADLTQYVEIDEPHAEEVHKDLNSGEILSKMKDRPLPPPPRPPRGSKKGKKKRPVEISDPESKTDSEVRSDETVRTANYVTQQTNADCVEEIEVSTQTDPLPDDVDFELGIEENIDVSVSSSLRDIIDEESMHSKSHRKTESPRFSRPTSRSEKSLKLSDPKISELSKPNVGRTSPTVILVERRVSSPTRINEREVMLTEASLTVQHIDIDESKIPDVPPLPQSRGRTRDLKSSRVNSQPPEEQALQRVTDTNSRDVRLDNLVTQRLQVRDLDVGRLNVSELQASKLMVSDIEGMTLQVTELDSKTGHISVSGIEFSQSIIDEIVKKFAEITTSQAQEVSDNRPVSREEHTQTDEVRADVRQDRTVMEERKAQASSEHTGESPKQVPVPPPRVEERSEAAPPPPPRPAGYEDTTVPQRPPPPDLTPLLYSYLQDMSLPAASFYGARTLRDRPFTEFHESQHHSPPTTTRRKRKPIAHQSESSSDDGGRPRPSPRRMPPPVRSHEPTVVEAGAQFLRVCHHSVNRVIRNMFNSLMSYISGAEDKKDVQMALVIFLVLIAGLIMFGLSDSRTVHHHHWEFFNPPDNKQ